MRIDPATFQEAGWQNREQFEHFENSEQPDCFACNSRMMLVPPLEVTQGAVLLPATTRLDDGRFVVMPHCWLLFPRRHAAGLLELPDNWTASIKQAVRKMGLEQPFCTGENWGREAGQTVAHAHTWIIGRGHGETGLLGEQTGLATMLMLIRQHGIVLP